MLYLSLFLLLVQLTYADVNIILDVDEVAIGDVVGLSVDSDEGQVDVEGLDNFNIISQGSGVKTIMTNGKVVSTDRSSYMLSPKKIGSFEISVQTKNGKKRKVIQVVEGEPVAEDSSVKTSKIPAKVYRGEKFVVSYDLLTKREVASASFRPTKPNDSFKVSEFPSNHKGVSKVGLSKYAKVNIDNLVFTPTKDGELFVPGRVLDLLIKNTRNFMGSFIDSHLVLEEHKIEVLPLPSEGQPQNFPGVVGTPTLEWSAGDTDVELGEAVALNIKLSGNCNLDGLGDLMKSDNNFKVFQTVIDKKESIEKGYFITKDFELVLTPKKAGEFIVPAIEIPYFDNVKKRYDVVSTRELKIKVKPKATHSSSQIVVEQVADYSTYNKFFTKRNIFVVLALILLGWIASLLLGYIFRPGLRTVLKDLSKSQDAQEQFEVFFNAVLSKKELDLKSASFEEVKEVFGDQLGDKIVDIISRMEREKYFSETSNVNFKRELANILKNIYK